MALTQHTLVAASAGTGKTTLMVQTFLELLDDGASPQEILTLTFTEKAAAELQERILKKLIDPSFAEKFSPEYQQLILTQMQEAYLGTFHQFCFRMIKHHQLLARSDELWILSDLALAHLRQTSIRKILNQHLETQNPTTTLLVDTLGFSNLLDALEEGLEQTLLTASPDSELELAFQQLVQSITQDYKTLCQELHAIDFNQMEEQVLAFLENNPKAAQRFCKRFRYILVDEFQDTSPTQLKMLEMIQDYSQQAKGHCWFFVVGDAKQSIYAFRQVEQSLIATFNQKLLAKGGTTQNLTTNYRSRPELVEIANLYCQTYFADTPPIHTPLEPELDFRPLNLIQIPTEKPNLKAKDRRYLEATILAEKILHYRQLNERLEDMAILYRANIGSEILMEVLRNYQIPFHIKGGQNLLAQQIFLDLKHLFEWTADPQDNLALAGVLRSPLFAISDALLYILAEKKGLTRDSLVNLNIDLFKKSDLLREIPKINRAHKILSTLLEIKSTHTLSAYLDRMEELVELDALLSMLDTSHGMALNYQQFRELLLALAKTLKTYTFDQWAHHLSRLWDKIKGLTPVSDLINPKNSITLLTIHAAKGLEFKHLLLYDLNKSPTKKYPAILMANGKIAAKIKNEQGKLEAPERYQSILETLQAENAHEERRIFYVALTRAKQSISLVAFQGEEPKKGSLLALLGNVLSLEDPRYLEVWNSNPMIEKKSVEKKLPELFPIPPARPFTEKSVSELETFAQCPQLHYYQYILKLSTDLKLSRTQKISQPQAGTLLHQALSQITKLNREAPLELLKKASILQQLPLDAPTLYQLNLVLTNYIKSEAYQEILAAQEDFCEIPFALLINDFFVRGQMDRLIKQDNQYVVIDFKYTEGSDETMQSYLFQLKTYALAASKMTNQFVGQTKIHLLKTRKIIPITFSQDDLLNHEKTLSKILSDMHQVDLSQVEKKDFCFQCPFHTQLKLCPIPTKNVAAHGQGLLKMTV